MHRLMDVNYDDKGKAIESWLETNKIRKLKLRKDEKQLNQWWFLNVI